MTIRADGEVDSTLKKVGNWLLCIFSIAIGLGLGFWLGKAAFAALSELPANKLAPLWGSGVIALTALWKAGFDIFDIMRGAWRYIRGQEKSYDHIRSLNTNATLMFGLVLGFETFLSGGDKVPPATTQMATDLVYVAIHDGHVLPSFLVSPMLSFKSAGLHNPKIEYFSRSSDIQRNVFNQEGISLSREQTETLSRLISKLASECIFDGSEKKLIFNVYGFANDQSFQRKDSRELNLAIANFRGQEIFEKAIKIVNETYPSLREEFIFKWRPWTSLEDMKRVRDYEVFRNIKFAVSPTIDYRSAVLSTVESGSCPRLNPDNLESAPFLLTGERNPSF